MPPAFPSLPPRIAGLAELAGNLAWSWNHEARELFRSIDERLWIRCRFDPLRLLARATPQRLAACAADAAFVTRYDGLMRWLQGERSDDLTWFAGEYPDLRGRTIAYFCAEFGVYHSVPIYSGGLGVLAGDHCKTASDLGIPIVGVGILYRGGYFDQRLRADGWQEDSEATFALGETPLEPIPGPHGVPYLAVVRAGDRDVHIRAWRLNVGRVPLILLDSDLEENDAADRGLLGRLYAGGPDQRLRQEWLLGVGGVRVLRALGYDPAAWHANEGHAAFMLVERLRELSEGGVSHDEAVRRVRASSVFTTHTPVPAGHDMFHGDKVAACTGPVWKEMDISREAFMGIGHHPGLDGDTFHMTVAAIRLSGQVNGVAQLHGDVSRKMWAPLWPGRTHDKVPIRHVTNGVHLATWMATPMIGLLTRYLGPEWGVRATDPAVWDGVRDIDETEMWAVHQVLKRTLFTLVREEARRQIGERGREADQLVGSGVLLDPDTLTIGFARRFATYKRADLIFRDVERLVRIATHAERPVQFVFAGKAHPADTPGKEVLQRVHQATRDPRFQGRVAFIEDYDLFLAHVLVQGVDVWLNLPTVPLEASGTSGMKAALNGVPQVSTVDGWWAEGFTGGNGWSIDAGGAEDPGRTAAELYDLLEHHVVPTYYQRTPMGVPRRWAAIMKEAIRVAGAHFTARRMLIEYARDYYAPAMTGRTNDDPPTA